ncbi:MAG: SGNH/GDSL hydrolase family protein [Planctomycetota bacterium]|jgi:lysophospholipase L1-like esterase
MPARRRSRFGSHLRLAALLLALLVLSLEVVVRCAGLVDGDGGVATPHHAAFNDANMFVPVDDPELSYRNKPDVQVTVDDVEYRHDARGRRVTPQAASGSAVPAADVPGVAFLGDSTTYGFGLRPEQTLPAQLAREVGGAIRPLNLAVCGYSTAQEAALYDSEREALQNTPLVVLVVYPNDFIPGVFQWDAPLRILYVDPMPLPRGMQRVLWRSALYRMSASWLAYRQRVRGDYSPHDPENVGAALDAIDRLAEAVRADGRQLLVAHLPALEALDPYEFEEETARLAARCERLGVHYVDLLDGFLEERAREVEAWEARTGKPAPDGPRRYFLSRYWLVDPSDHHPNAEAVRVAARVLAPRIRELLSLSGGG